MEAMLAESQSRRSARGEFLRGEILKVRPQICVERALIVTRAYQETEGQPMVIRRAKALDRVLRQMTVRIYDRELIVGNRATRRRNALIFPEYSIDWIEEELDSFPTRDVDQFVITDEDKNLLRSTVFPYWRGKTVKERALSQIPEDTRRAMRAGVFTCALYLNDGLGHVLLDYEKILRRGFSGVAADAEVVKATLDIARNPGDVARMHFLDAVVIVCRAAISFARRFAAEARRLAAEEKDGQRKAELLDIAAICDRVPAAPARTFREALQCFWFIQLITQIDANGLSISPGRFDQYMFPYYANDVRDGRLTRDEALELLDCLWAKFTEIIHLYNLESARNNAGFPISQNLVVGGQTSAGIDATNDLSFLCLEAGQRMQVIQPNFGVRLHEGTSEAFLSKACEVIRTGIGMPQTFNDEVIVPSLLNRGIPIADARNYGLVGCVEPSVPGKTWGMTNSGYFSLPKCLELMLNRGGCTLCGEQVGVDVGDPATFKTFEGFLEAYRREVSFFVRHMVVTANVIELAHRELAPLPWVSCMVDDCVGRAKDVTDGGAVYNFSGPQGVGVANVADSLSVIRKLVIEDKVISAPELLELLGRDFAGAEDARHLLMTRAPRYGNDDDYVDMLAREVAALYCREVEKYPTPRGGTYQPGVYPTTAHIALGSMVGATPDGRKARQPLADGVSPSHGSDRKGITAVIRSVAKLDHALASNGTQFNQKLSPDAIAGREGLARLAVLLRTWVGLKGMHIQFNVVSAATLRDAQRHPEKYAGLMVRVAGYSAFFNELSPQIQEDIIGRTEHQAV